MIKKIKKIFCRYTVVLPLFAGAFLLVSCAGKPDTVESEVSVEVAGEVSVGVSGELYREEEAGRDADIENSVPDTFERPASGGLVFIPSPLPPLAAAVGVGNITRERRDRASQLSGAERDALGAAFRGAYVDGILRGLGLEGVLGGDLVHSWPENAPSLWVQNWQTAEARPNSWGIPSLVLAIRNIETTGEGAQSRVFIVRGGILDFYGKSAGVGGANGGKGYGCPRSEEFSYNGGTAQRFDRGLITVDEDGKGAFVPGAPPSAGAVPPPDLGAFSPEPPGGGGAVRDAFITAWKMALDSGREALVPDGPGFYAAFSGDPFALGARGVYVQSFNQQTAVLALIDTNALPFHARLIAAPFLPVLLSAEDHPAAALEENFSGGGAFIRRRMRGFAVYGLPLTDALSGWAGPAYREAAQRFSRGALAASGNQ
jgi:hypothetical protein